MITIKVTPEDLNRLENDYLSFITDRNIGYILFVAKTEDNIITAYDNKKKNQFKVTIQGKDELDLASKYTTNLMLLPNPRKHKENNIAFNFIDVDHQIGSDEVGTGDFFGPIVVCAAYVDHDTMGIIEEYGVADSKKLTDTKILEIVPLLMKKVHYVCNVFNNVSYNKAVDSGFNMNQIKCRMHNYVLVKLHERCPYVTNIYVDKFTSEELYYKYLDNVNRVEKGIVFREKGESFFPSVALASCIARYIFLKEIEKMSEKYQMKIPLGASNAVDEFAKKFVEKYGMDELLQNVKKNFKNLEELIKSQTSLF